MDHSTAIEIPGHPSRKLKYRFDENGKDIRRLQES